MSRDIPDRLIRNLSKASLTPPEHELMLLRCLSHGMTIGMAAEATGRSTRQTAEDLSRARIRLYAKNNMHAVATALRQGLID